MSARAYEPALAGLWQKKRQPTGAALEMALRISCETSVSFLRYLRRFSP
jgi:hypothetical protein